MPSTVISPSVSKARKSTSITLTTLVPPPSGSACSRKNGEMLCGALRVSIAYDSAARPPPASTASTRSRRRRHCARSRGARVVLQRSAWAASAGRAGTARWSRLRPPAASAPGRAPRTRRRSGTARCPTTPSRIRAASRWNLACQAAPTARRAPIAHSSTNSGVAGTRSPLAPLQRHQQRRAEAGRARDHQHPQHLRSAGAGVPVSRIERRAARVSWASTASNSRLPSSAPISGVSREVRCLKRPA